MTHVLNLTLRKVLGTECHQKGSLVDADKLRFDYSTNKSLSVDQIDSVCKECNNIIGAKLKVFTDQLFVVGNKTKTKELKNKDRAYQKVLGKQRKKKVIDIVPKINMDQIPKQNIIHSRCE